MHPAASKALFDAEVAALPGRLLDQRGWILNSAMYPLLDCSFTAPERKTLRLRLACDDWNDLPPSISLLDSAGSQLTRGPTDPKGVFNNSAHPSTGRPFICMRGSREYHTHSSHVNDLWAPLRSDPRYTLFNIVGQIWNAWLNGKDW